MPVCREEKKWWPRPGLLEVDFGRREEDLREAKRVPARAADTRLITPSGVEPVKTTKPFCILVLT